MIGTQAKLLSSCAVVADGVRFHAITYQELIARLGEHRDEHPLYVRYLTERYLWGVRAATNSG